MKVLVKVYICYTNIDNDVSYIGETFIPEEEFKEDASMRINNLEPANFLSGPLALYMVNKVLAHLYIYTGMLYKEHGATESPVAIEMLKVEGEDKERVAYDPPRLYELS